MTLSYDFTFLALLLWEPEGRAATGMGRCYANPLCKVEMCSDNGALELAADESVILTWWKLRDSIQDESFWKGLPSRAFSWLLRPAYRKAAKRRPQFDREVQRNLELLAQLEREGCPSLDRAADAFASLLRAAVPEDWEQQRILGQLLYHLGRWIYLADAKDDFAEDAQAKRYNPVAARYGPAGDDKALCFTMDASLEQMGAALQLGEFGCRKDILENVVYLGLPLVQRAIFDGSWAQMKKQKIWRSRR
jgi:hypothetical protein